MREQAIVAESLTDVQDEEDLEGYGFGCVTPIGGVVQR